jgi:hypothetical protein
MYLTNMPFEIEEAGHFSNNRMAECSCNSVTDINGKVIALKGIHKIFLKKTNSEESRSKLKLLLNY